MKKLMRLKLVNWHYFINETLTFEGNTLITGENGAGKSTILDAMLYVLTAGKQQFNSAANDKTKRDLIGYVRCKTGHDANQYLRNGDITSHIALEFLDEKKNAYFIIGVVIDSSSDLSTPKTLFYRIENTRFDDNLFFKDSKHPREINNFKAKIKEYDYKILETLSKARSDFLHRFGQLNERFTLLLPKALAFRPINNVKDFVYDYLLEKKEVEIEYLKQNINTLKEFEKHLDKVKHQLNDLTKIDETYQEYLQLENNIQMQEYIIRHALVDQNQEKINSKNNELSKTIIDIENTNQSLSSLKQKMEDQQKYLNDLRISLINNDTFKLVQDLENKIRDLELQLENLEMRRSKLVEKLKHSFGIINQLLEDKINITNLSTYYDYKDKKITKDNITTFRLVTNTLAQEIKNYRNSLSEKKGTLKNKIEIVRTNLQEVRNEIAELNKKRLIYPSYVTNLHREISNQLSKHYGKDLEPKIFCELIDIKDDLWRNAIEGYLNTQRFNLFVEPEYFDFALEVYERVKFALNIHTVGLVNTKQLEEYQDINADSLAYMISTEHYYARLYANMLLNKVIRCDKVEDLQKYNVAITPTCMVYQNKTARQIKKDIYEQPFIGKEAYKVQLQKKEQEEQLLLKELDDLMTQLNQIEKVYSLCDNIDLNYVYENCDLFITIEEYKDRKRDYEQKLKDIDRSSYLDLQFKISKTENELRQLQNDKEYIEGIRNDLNVNKRIIMDNINSLQNEYLNLTDNLRNTELKLSHLLPEAEKRYQNSLERYKNDYQKIIEIYSSQKKGLETQLEKKLGELKELQWTYNRNYDFSAETGILGMDTYYREAKILRESKVVEYEEKIRDAKRKAEEQFKDEFISKLQEYIYTAQREFTKLNEALSGIRFGNDEYRFKWYLSKTKQKFYEMIMDRSNIGGNTLFSETYQNQHREALEELFSRISISDDESQKALEEYTDYRSYMDYDIQIIHSNNNTSSYNKVGREKSGGETQTPFYVAIAASFIQLYHSNSYDDSIGLILFDEAFDKMDDNRIESMMTFFNRLNLNLQIILAAPPQKVETISPYVKTTLMVYHDDNASYVELFQHDKL